MLIYVKFCVKLGGNVKRLNSNFNTDARFS